MGYSNNINLLHKGWISMSDKNYGFQTTSISEMDMCKETYIYIYIHVCIYIYIHVSAMTFRYLFICIDIRKYFSLQHWSSIHIHFASPPTFFSNICNPSTIPWQANVRVAGNLLCCRRCTRIIQYYIYYILKLCHTLPYTIQ